MGPMPARRSLANLRAFSARCFTLATLLAATTALGIPAASASSRVATNWAVNAHGALAPADPSRAAIAALATVAPTDTPANPAPAVVPALRDWTGGHGSFLLVPQSHIVIARDSGAALSADASTFRDDLRAITGRDLTIITGGQPHAGDIYLALDIGAAPAGSPAGRYSLAIGDAATIQAATATGVFYGEQTIEQILKLDSVHHSMPQGLAADWPAAGQRGLMLDMGRHYYTPAYVRNQIREAAWYKLNVVHMHLTEANAFRLDSPKFPGLAAAQSYTRSDIAAFEATAAKYHVMIVPEIDLPAHATAITNYWPQTTWDCAPMNDERGRNFTVDVTKQYTRDVVKQLLDEFIPWFTGPEFHIGADEYPYQSTQERCPELVSYAKAHNFASTSDVFVQFIDYLNSIVRAHGKTAVAWGWWDDAGQPTIEPDRNIIVEAYGGSPASDTAQHFLQNGYQVLYANGNQLYTTPGLNLFPDNQSLYTQWPTVNNTNVLGYMFSRWSDNEETQPDAYFDWYARMPQAVLADRTWGGPALASVFDFENRVDQLGTAPGVPEAGDPEAVLLHGTPYGSSPAFDPSSTYDKAYDGDVTTYFDYAQPNGGYTGIDLGAGHAARITKIRFVPRASQPARMTGGRFQGCTDGPTTGCHDLATVTWRPTYDWYEITVTDPAAYRWLRYLSPDNGFANVAEIQYYSAPVTAGRVAVSAPATMRPLGSYGVTTTFTNITDVPLHDLTLSLAADSLTSQAPLAASADGPASFGAVGPHASVSVTWHIQVPLAATPGDYHLAGRAIYRPDGSPTSGQQDAQDVAVSTMLAPITAQLDPADITPAAGSSATTNLRVTDNTSRPLTLTWGASAAGGSGITVPGGQPLALQPGATATTKLTVLASEASAGVTTVPLDLKIASGGETAYGGGLDLTVSVFIKDGQLYLAGTKALTRDGANWTDYDLSFTTIPYQTGRAGQYAQAGWFFRAQAPTVPTGAWDWPGSGYLWLLGNSGSSGALTKVVLLNGNITSAATVQLPFPITAGEAYHIRTVVRGNTFLTYVNGTLVDTTSDNTFSSGRVGFREDGDESASFGDLQVTAPNGQVLFSTDFSSTADLAKFDGLLPGQS